MLLLERVLVLPSIVSLLVNFPLKMPGKNRLGFQNQFNAALTYL